MQTSKNSWKALHLEGFISSLLRFPRVASEEQLQITLQIKLQIRLQINEKLFN